MYMFLTKGCIHLQALDYKDNKEENDFLIFLKTSIGKNTYR